VPDDPYGQVVFGHFLIQRIVIRKIERLSVSWGKDLNSFEFQIFDRPVRFFHSPIHVIHGKAGDGGGEFVGIFGH
jgi:hypothetical protein